MEGPSRRSPWGAPRPPHPRFAWRLLLLAGLAGLALVLLLSAFPPVAWRDGAGTDLVRYGLIGLVLLVSAAAARRSLLSMAGGLVIWSLIALLLIALYAYRVELGAIWQRVAGELLPTRGQEGTGGSVSFARSSDQHFRIDALVNGQPVRFLLDTGASSVVLTRADAQRLGFDADRLAYTQLFQTANGTVRAAPVRLKEIRIGPIAFEDLPASVNEGELGQSLLGMRLLERFSSIEIRNDRLIITR